MSIHGRGPGFSAPFRKYDSGARYVFPGAGAGARINAKIDELTALYAADGVVRAVHLFTGTYTLETAILLKSGVRLIGAGRSTVINAVAITGTVDDPTNAAIKALGATSGNGTTLGAILKKGQTSATLTSGSGFATGDHVLLYGNNASSNSGRASDGTSIVLYEVQKISNLAGATVTLAWGAMQYHATHPDTTVKVLAPVVDAGIADLYIDANGGTCAVGVLARSCIKFTAEGVAGRGFTRALVDVDRGTMASRFDDIFSDGSNNAAVLLDSAINCVVEGVRTNPIGPRENTTAGAVPRGMISLRNRCTSCFVRDLHLVNVPIGIQIHGGIDNVICDAWIDDWDSDNADARGTTAGERDNGARRGGGVEMDATTSAYNEKAINLSLENIHVGRGVGQAAASEWLRVWSFYVHDVLELKMSNCSVDNSAQSAGDVTLQQGFHFRDSSGEVNHVTARGVYRGFGTSGTVLGLWLDDVFYEGASDTGTGGAYAFSFDHVAGCAFHLGRVRIGNVVSFYVEYGANFTAAEDWDLTIDDLETGLGRWTGCIMAENATANTFQAGDLVEVIASTAGQRQIDRVAAPSKRGCAVALVRGTAASTGYTFVCPLPARVASVLCTTAAVEVGDLLEHSGTVYQAVVNNTPAANTCIGRALENKANGATGKVLVGPSS